MEKLNRAGDGRWQLIFLRNFTNANLTTARFIHPIFTPFTSRQRVRSTANTMSLKQATAKVAELGADTNPRKMARTIPGIFSKKIEDGGDSDLE